MTKPLTIRRYVHVANDPKPGAGHRKVLRAGKEPPVSEQPQKKQRIPRVSRLMALAIHGQDLLNTGAVRDLSELARLVHVSQPRMTQIMNLNLLAPSIQEELLFLDPGSKVTERELRPLAGQINWTRQLGSWQALIQKRN
jgi:hypothetical protein